VVPSLAVNNIEDQEGRTLMLPIRCVQWTLTLVVKRLGREIVPF
jgi:hypothetical protein